MPPGFRFHPRDDELVCDYLMKKVSGNSSIYGCPMMIDVDLNKCEPWDLPGNATNHTQSLSISSCSILSLSLSGVDAFCE
ncbi:hypothetical protein GW17_00037460 [Ensete ventricosum]|nr:hypothetical protein GW17_00037460 [Ensete ventricosum]